MKQTEISKLNLNDLEVKISELKKKLFDLRMSSYVSELENPIQIRNTRRIIARLKTAKTKLTKDLIN
ncbi:MAG: 50S ribosomal protein L29 [Flavobacteriales bacterium TMED96]|nr:MAG: 50S ribosomal protein L29 [Flavobacteriales bacterium TMED96]|tara:strand:- start:685 stop:885 length:201 start_codon:yes stop_codon:yes gene_type:complete